MQASCLSPSAPAVTLYEQQELFKLTGGTLRPGGMALTAELLSFCNLAPGSAVLDIGCGPGHTLNLLASNFRLRATGLDPSAVMLGKAAEQAPNAELLQGSATAIPCDDQRFDGITCECVLSLTSDITTSLREMHRVLRPGGILILTDIYCKRPEQELDLPQLRSCISSALPLDAITDGLEGAGFTLVSRRERSDLLKQLTGQIIFSYGSLENSGSSSWGRRPPAAPVAPWPPQRWATMPSSLTKDCVMDETSLRIMQLAAQGFCCSQIMIQLSLEDMGEKNIPLVRAMAGLCDGIGMGDLCGVASGAACVMALYAAKGSVEEQALDSYPLLLTQFMDWFQQGATAWGGIRCDEIIAFNGGRKPEVCGDIMVRARDTILAILVEHNIDPSLPKEQTGAY